MNNNVKRAPLADDSVGMNSKEKLFIYIRRRDLKDAASYQSFNWGNMNIYEHIYEHAYIKTRDNIPFFATLPLIPGRKDSSP